jgi:tetratricopeptide (TPR) repeat protein
VAFSQDGTRIATGHYNKTATIWDAETLTALVELIGHTGNVNSVAFSPDGKRVVTGGGDRTVKIWDTLTGATLVELKGHTGPVTSVSFSADGTRIVSASRGTAGKPGEVFVWDARTSKEPPDLEEIAYRRLHTQPNPSRFRAGYLAARAVKDDFAAAFYLKLIPTDQRKALLEQAETEAFAALSKLAGEYRSAGKLEDAVPLYIEVLNFNKAKLGPEDPATIQTADTLGFIYWRMGQFEKAIPLYKDVVKYRQAKKDPRTLNTIQMLGLTYRDAGRLKEAIAVFEEAAAKAPGMMANLLDVYALAGEHARVIAVCQKELAVVRKSRPKDTYTQADLLARLGRAYLAQKKWSEAEPHLRECATIRKKNQPDDWMMFDAQSLLGGSLLGQKKYAEAEPLLLKGYEGLKQRKNSIPKGSETCLLEAIDRLIELTMATNQPDEAKKWRAERANYPKAAPLSDKDSPQTPRSVAAVEKLIARMTDPAASFKDRCAAEDEVVKLPPEVALPKLLPLRAKGMPAGGIWNSLGTRELDHRGPVSWQIYYAIDRVWREQLGRAGKQQGDAQTPKTASGVLLALLRAAGNDKERSRVLQALSNYWDPKAEADLAKLLRDGKAPSDIRQGAAFALILHGKEDYRETMLQWAVKAGQPEKERWFELLADLRYKKRKGVDPRVVHLGFKLIQADKASAYFLALRAGAYVGEEFAPDHRDPRYQIKDGRVPERYFVDTVNNAVRWWDKNHQKFEQK